MKDGLILLRILGIRELTFRKWFCEQRQKHLQLLSKQMKANGAEAKAKAVSKEPCRAMVG